jgi:hypothetical protein
MRSWRNQLGDYLMIDFGMFATIVSMENEPPEWVEETVLDQEQESRMSRTQLAKVESQNAIVKDWRSKKMSMTGAILGDPKARTRQARLWVIPTDATRVVSKDDDSQDWIDLSKVKQARESIGAIKMAAGTCATEFDQSNVAVVNAASTNPDHGGAVYANVGDETKLMMTVGVFNDTATTEEGVFIDSNRLEITAPLIVRYVVAGDTWQCTALVGAGWDPGWSTRQPRRRTSTFLVVRER